MTNAYHLIKKAQERLKPKPKPMVIRGDKNTVKKIEKLLKKK